MGNFINPDITSFKGFFQRDFPYGIDQQHVMDQDIANALVEASFYMDNSTLFDSQGIYTLCFLYLAAHFLVISLRTSSQGISGQYNFLQAGKGVGGASESFSIPQRILDNPNFAMFAKTNYGIRYLEKVLPALTGNVFTVCGATLP